MTPGTPVVAVGTADGGTEDGGSKEGEADDGAPPGTDAAEEADGIVAGAATFAVLAAPGKNVAFWPL